MNNNQQEPSHRNNCTNKKMNSEFISKVNNDQDRNSYYTEAM